MSNQRSTTNQQEEQKKAAPSRTSKTTTKADDTPKTPPKELPNSSELLVELGRKLLANGKYGEARAHYEKALPLTQDTLTRARILNNLGLIERHTNQLEAAEGYYQQALDLWQRYGDLAGEATTLYNLAQVLKTLKRYDEAYVAMQRCVELDTRLQHPDLKQDKAVLAELEKATA